MKKKTIVSFLLCVCSAVGFAETINIDTHRTQPQKWEGWGVSLCWWAQMCGKYDEQHLDSLISWLTDPQGLNYNIFRYNIGGGDDPEWKNCEPHHMGKRGGKGLRAEMEGFQLPDGTWQWDNDAAQRRVMLMIAKRRKDAIFEAFSNSAPWWMTKSGCVGGNEPATADNLREDMYGKFADYLVTVCKHYNDKYGITFRTLEPFNEALTDYWGRSASQEGCHFSVESQIKFIKTLYPVLRQSGLKTVISASDETSVGHSLQAFRGYKEAGILPMIGQWNTHTYHATPEQRRELRKEVTETRGGDNMILWQSETGDGGRGLHGNLMMAKRLIADIRYMQPSAWLDWQYVEVNYDQWSLVKCDREWKQYTRHKNYYVRQHFSRFVPAGYRWLNIDSDNALAAVSPDGKTMAVVMVNTERRPVKNTMNLPEGWKYSEGYVTDFLHDMAPIGEQQPTENGEIILDRNSIVTLIYTMNPKKLTIEDLTSGKYAPKGVKMSEVLPGEKDKASLTAEKAEQIYRRSSRAIYKYGETPIANGAKVEQPLISPDGKNVAYVKDNNLYIEPLTSHLSPLTSVVQVTTDGEYNKIINGKPDWVYEEELVYARAFCFNADGTMLCWQRFDESKVPTFSFPVYKGLKPEKKKNALYPSSYEYKYPMAGVNNSKVKVLTYDIATKEQREIKVPVDSDGYILRVLQTSDADKIIIPTLNRHQDCLKIYVCNPRTGECRLIVTDEVKPYINEATYAGIQMTEGGFVLQSERTGYAQIYLYDLDGNIVRALTEGNQPVVSFYGYDEKTKRCYYAAKDGSPLRTAVFARDAKGKTTKLTPREGTNSATFSKDYRYFVNMWSNIDTPPVYTLCDAKTGKVLKVLEDNAKLKKKADCAAPYKREFFTMTTSEGTELNGWMIRPDDENKPHPVVMFQYSGPGSQQVEDKWYTGNMGGCLFEEYLAQEGFVSVCVDGRGTGGRGADFEKQTYLHLGAMESHDQAEVARWLGEQPYVDKDRIGIWGWSYGGFMTLMSMSDTTVVRTDGKPLFAAGVAVAPVTSYRYYDTIYTERFMRTPKENPEGYDDNPITRAPNLRGKLLICQGTADDNVHYRNVAEYTEALVQADKDYMQLSFTNRNHNISGGNTRNFLFRNIAQWFKKNLQK